MRLLRAMTISVEISELRGAVEPALEILASALNKPPRADLVAKRRHLQLKALYKQASRDGGRGRQGSRYRPAAIGCGSATRAGVAA
jgi:hypothetical protein